MKYYLIAGEASGDLHGANLIKGLKKADPEAVFRFWGGDRMAAAGGAENLARHYKTASFFGLTDVIAHIGTILRQFAECKADIAAYDPDVLILIDYPGFNFRMARFARKRGIRTFYYISPKVWAWNESRIRRIRRDVEQLFIIFPFEIDYFRNKGIDAIYEGNPLVDAVEEQLATVPDRNAFFADNGWEDRPYIALLAGSRRSEIEKNLPVMAALAERFPAYDFIVAGVSWIDDALYDRYLAGTRVKRLTNQTYPILAHAEAAVVTSGTATLETALIGIPEVVVYRTNRITLWAGLRVLKIKYISLVNLILDRPAVAEIIQTENDAEPVEHALRAILPGGMEREPMLADFAELRRIVGKSGASERFARRMVELLRNKRPKK